MPFVKYTLLRVLFILVAAGILFLLNIKGLLLWILAIVIGGLVSYLALPKQRAAVVDSLSARRQHEAETGERFSPEIEQDAATGDDAHFED